MYKFFRVLASLEGELVELYGSYIRDECICEINAEGEQWRREGHTKIHITYESVEQAPDREVYAEEYKSGFFK